MWHATGRYRTRTVFREVLPRSDDVSPVRHRSSVSFSMGSRVPRSEALRIFRDVAVHRSDPGRLYLRLEKRRARMGTLSAKHQVKTRSASATARSLKAMAQPLIYVF